MPPFHGTKERPHRRALTWAENQCRSNNRPGDSRSRYYPLTLTLGLAVNRRRCSVEKLINWLHAARERHGQHAAIEDQPSCAMDVRRVYNILRAPNIDVIVGQRCAIEVRACCQMIDDICASTSPD